MRRPATMAIELMPSTKFLLENKWISFLPVKAPIPAPMGTHPVRIPLAISVGIVMLKMRIMVSNSMVLM